MKRPFRIERCVRVAVCTGAAALLVQAASAQEQPPPGHQAKFADAGSVRLHYIDFGGEGLPVILVPAVTRDATHYEPLGPLLTAGNRVLAITRRGDGPSEDPGGPYDAQTQARDFLHFMDALEIPQAVFVSNVGDEITYLAEEHPHRVAGLVFLGGPARGATGEVLRTEPTGMAEALRRLWQSAAGLPPDYFGYVPRYLQSGGPTIGAPALVFVTADGMRGVERENPALMMVGSPLTAAMVRGLRPEDGRAHFERLANDPQYRDGTLDAITDSVARSYFQRLAADAELQAQVQRFQEETLIPAEIAHWSAFRRAFAGTLELVQLDVPAVSGYEYNSAPELIAPHIRPFLEDIRPSGGADTVHVAPPTGERDADRASILAALAAVQEGSTVQFARGTYLIGEMIRVSVPRVTLLGHPEGTTLRGCDPEDVVDMETSMEVCNGLELAGPRQTVRGFTFEHAFWALHLGCCYDERTTYDFPDGSTHEISVVRRGEGGHRVEGNTFRSNSSGIRVNGGWTEPSIVRGNRFIDNWHAVSINGHTVHVLDNHFLVPQPERVPNFGYAWDAIKIAPPMPIQGDAGPPACIGNVIAGNTIEGYLDGIRVEVYLPGSICRENVIRDNTITVRRAHNPSGVHFGDGGDRSDSTVVGVPIALLNDPMSSADAGSDAPTFVEENIVEGNRILGAEGIGIEILRASRNRIVNNIIERVVAREPFPGNTMAGAPDAWQHANGSGIWISPASDENEIAGNTFENVAGDAIVLEGDNNGVEVRRASDSVRDLGSANRVISRAVPPSATDTLGIAALWHSAEFVDEAATVRDTVRYSVIIEGQPWAERRVWQEAPDTWWYEYEGPGFYGHLAPGTERVTLDAAGIPVGMVVSLPAPSVQERFERDDRRARWSVSRNDGPGSMSSRTVEQDEVESPGPAYYSPIHRIHDVGVVARALLRQPNGVLPLLPEGEARLEPLGTRTVEADGRTRTVLHYAVHGGDLKPAYVWLDADGATFADEWSILAGWEPVFSELRAETAATLAEHHRHLAAGLVPPARERPLVIRGASLFDPQTGAVRSGTTIVVEGNRIAVVGADASIETPAGAEVIEAAGRTVLPGLWDMHAYHGISQDYLELEAPLRLAAGVTTARDMGSPPEAIRSLRQRIEAGDALGPRLLLGGLIEGTGGPPLGLLAGDADEARAAVDRYAEMGYVQIKTYNRLPADVIRAVTERARHHGLRMSGHVPPGMTLGETVENGFDEAQHINQIFRHLALPETGVEAEAALGPDSEAGRGFIDMLVARGAAIDPNLGDAYLGRCEQRAWVEEVASRLPALAARRFRAGIALWACPHPRMDEALANMSGLVRAAHEAGVPVLPGAIMSPGFGLHTELVEYAAAGIPAPDVLHLATLGAARVMGMDAELGSIEPGKLADLILVDGNPAADIRDIRRVMMVVKDGRVYDPAAIYGALGIRPCCDE